MKRHIVANLWLLGLTLVICCVAYPLALLGVGQVVFPNQANGSLITNEQGAVVGSRLIAQPFSSDKHFHPRPSAVSYNAAATGGTNWGASNPALRTRVVDQLGTVLKYGAQGSKPGQPIAPDIAAWAESTTESEESGEQGAEAPEEDPGADYLAWRAAHPDEDLEAVPADMVMASGAGLDPHITLQNALYQLDRVSAGWATETGRDSAELKTEIEALLREHAEAPLGGLVGVEIVNVLEINLALADKYGTGGTTDLD
jgi:K+-transporting ATPase ATPase C chain